MRGYCLQIGPAVLEHYQHELGIASAPDAMRGLAAAVAATAPPELQLRCVLTRVHSTAALVLLTSGGVSPEGARASLAGIVRACERLRYVDYKRAQDDAELLASRLKQAFQTDVLRAAGFAAIGRGGRIALGMLSYALGLASRQLEPPFPPGSPLFVVDDCALTGARFREFAGVTAHPSLVLATLYAPAGLLEAITAKEPRIVGAIAARELHDSAPSELGPGLQQWREQWIRRLQPERYWVGRPDHVSFAWSEPDRSVWNAQEGRVQRCPRIVPPSHCLKNRRDSGTSPVESYVQPVTAGVLEVRDSIVYGGSREQVYVASTESGEILQLEDSTAESWWALVECRSLEEAAARVACEYEVETERAMTDLRQLAGSLSDRGIGQLRAA